MNDDFDARSFAAYALSQLLFKDSSVDVGIRSVLRIADHKKLTWWRLWATLQLLTLDGHTFDEQIGEVLDDDFPEEKATQRQSMLDEAIDEYNYLRASYHPSNLTTAAVAVMEKDAELSEVAYSQGKQGGLQMALEYAEILNRIKSRVQAFLTEIEMGGKSPTPPRRVPGNPRMCGPLRKVRREDAAS